MRVETVAVSGKVAVRADEEKRADSAPAMVPVAQSCKSGSGGGDPGRVSTPTRDLTRNHTFVL